jgi:tetratricopeptide (TPR) repeat protein
MPTRGTRARRSRWALCLIGWVAGWVAGCADPIETTLAQAAQHAFEANYVGAERLYQEARQRLRVARDSPLRRQQSAWVLQRLGTLHALYLRDPPRAVAEFEELANGPTSEGALVALGSLADLYAHALLDLPAAIGAYRRLVAEFHDRPAARRAQLRVVEAFVRLQDYPQARAEARRLLRLYPDSAEARLGQFELASSFILEDRFACAVDAFEALAAEPLQPAEQALVGVELATCYQQLGRPHQAIDALHAALAAHPQPQLVRAKLARLQGAMRQQAPAYGIFKVARRRAL